MSTPITPTEAHNALAEKIADSFFGAPAFKWLEIMASAAQLIAKSEARVKASELFKMGMDLIAERDQLRAKVATLTAEFTPNGALARENESLRAAVESAKNRIESLEHERTSLAMTEEKLRAEVERLTAESEGRRKTLLEKADELRAEWIRAEKAEREMARLEKQIKDDNRSYGCELRDPNGTIWEQATANRARAEKAEAELHALRLVCGTSDANKFETALDREREKVRVLSALLSRIYKNLASGWLPAGLYEDLRATLAATTNQPKTEEAGP